MPSRQCLWNRKNDCQRLQAQAPEGLRIEYGTEGGRAGYTVRRGQAQLLRGRYEVVAAWLSGYREGQQDADRLARP